MKPWIIPPAAVAAAGAALFASWRFTGAFVTDGAGLVWHAAASVMVAAAGVAVVVAVASWWRSSRPVRLPAAGVPEGLPEYAGGPR